MPFFRGSTQIFFQKFFENAQKTVIYLQKQLKLHQLFLCVFKITEHKNICVSIVQKAESGPKHTQQFFFWGGGFSTKTKNLLFRGSKMVLVLFKSNFKFAFMRLFFNVKGSCMPIFTKNIIFGPPGILRKCKTLTCVRWGNFGVHT